MSQKMSLKEAERKVYHSSINDGLWDILLGCYFLIFTIAPFLSESLGDFWSSAVFLPFWGAVYLIVRLLRRKVVSPRLGVVKYGPIRIKKLKRFSYVMLVLNIIALILGSWFAFNVDTTGGQPPYVLGMMLLIGFSLAAVLLDIKRLYLYGLLTGIAPMVGEWLWNNAKVSHHGFPITFGVVSGIMILVGVSIFIRLLRSAPMPNDFLMEES